MISLRLGKENVNGQKLDVFRVRITIVVLLYSLCEDEQDALDSVVCDTMDANVTYHDVM